MSEKLTTLRERLRNFFHKVEKNIYLSTFFVFVFFILINGIIYFTVANVSSTDDQWFYTKIAYLLRTQGFSAVTQFQGAYFTDLVQSGYSYAAGLYHYFLIPFTIFSNKIFGLKLSGLVMASSVLTLMYWTIHKFGFKYPFLWTVFFFYSLSDHNFISRLFFNRPFVLADALVILEIYLISKRKLWPFFWISLIHTWWHPATFWLPIFLAGCFEVARIIHAKKIDYKTVLAGFLGSMAAFLLFPPHSHTFLSPLNPINFIKTLFSFIYGMNDNLGVIEGSENLNGDILQFSSQNSILFIFLVVFVVLNVFAYVGRRSSGQDLDKNEERSILRDYAFIVTIIFLLGYVFSMRFLDLIVPMIFLDTIILFNLLADNGYISISNVQVRKAVAYSIIVLFLFIGGNKVLNMRNGFGNSQNYSGYEKAAEWLMKNTNQGDIVFNTDFGQFNRLFFYDSYNRYIVGLEPKSLYRYDQERYWLWHNIIRSGVAYGKGDYSDQFKNLTEGKKEDQLEGLMLANARNIANVIKNKFSSRYVFFEGDTFLRRELEKDPADFDLAYHDDDRSIYIYKIK